MPGPARRPLAMVRLPRPAPALLAALLVLAVTLAVYAGALSAGFTLWDDGNTIYKNPNLGALGLDRVIWAFTDSATAMRWIPLTLLSLSLNFTLGGLDPFGYHLGNWLLHGAAAVALFALLAALLGRAARRRGWDDAGPWPTACAAAGALAWSLHPLRVEVVAWANGRGHALATLFAFLALLVYARAHAGAAPAPRPWRVAAASAGLFLAALMSHPIAIGVAPVFLLLDVHLGRLGGEAGWWSPAARRALLEKLPFAAAAGVALVVNVLIRVLRPGQWPAPVPLEDFGVFPRAVQATWIWVHYVLVTLWPAGLQPAPTALIRFDPWTAPFLLRAALVPAVTAGLFAVRRRWPTALLLWLAHLALLVPSLGLFEHPMFACDRYDHLPGLVPAAIAGAGLLLLGAAPARRRVLGVGSAALLAVLGALSVVQVRVWENSVTLFEHMLPLIGDHPYRASIHLMLGWAYDDRGDAPRAVASYQEALPLEPLNPMLRVMLGDSLARSGRVAEAAPHYEVAVKFYPDAAGLRCSLAGALVAAGRPGEALTQARVAFALEPEGECAGRLLSRLAPPGAR